MTRIKGPARLLELRLAERCYTLDEIEGCVTSREGSDIEVDTAHPSYPRVPKEGCTPDRVAEILSTIDGVYPPDGVGTELKKLLARVGITATPGCKCNRRAAHMNSMGVEWCEQPENQLEIIGWLREEAEDRGLPFVDIAGRLLLKRAIANAKRLPS